MFQVLRVIKPRSLVALKRAPGMTICAAWTAVDGRKSSGGELRLAALGLAFFFCRRLLQLEDAVFRPLVSAQAEENGSAHLRAAAEGAEFERVCPLGEPHLRDELGPQPVDALHAVARAIERRMCCFEFLKFFPDVLLGALVEPAAHLPNVQQVFLVAVEAKDERTEVRARALRIGVSAHHALLLARDLHLQPVARALLLVAAPPPLGD